MIQLVQGIQKLRKFTLNLQPPSLQERQEIVEKLLVLMSEANTEIPMRLSQETGLTKQATQQWEIDGLVELARKTSLPSAENYPVGVVALISPKIFPIRTTLERWIPSFLAGNATLIKMSSKTPVAAEILGNWMRQAGVPEESYQILNSGRAELGDFLTSHPAIRAFSFVGSQGIGESLVAKGLWGRRTQMWLGGFTTNLILDSEGLSAAIDSLTQQLKENIWQTPLFPQRWIVLDSIEVEAAAALDKALPTIVQPEISEFFIHAESEEGKPRQGWLHHLPLCSVIQQSEVRLPTVSLNAVRYPFDMQKWVNHANTAYAVQIWGTADKAAKITSKFEVGRITINQPLNFRDSILFGAKQSIFGTVDLNPGGLFFSECRSVKTSTNPTKI